MKTTRRCHNTRGVINSVTFIQKITKTIDIIFNIKINYAYAIYRTRRKPIMQLSNFEKRSLITFGLFVALSCHPLIKGCLLVEFTGNTFQLKNLATSSAMDKDLISIMTSILMQPFFYLFKAEKRITTRCN